MASIAFLMTAKVMGSPGGASTSGICVLHLDGDAARSHGSRRAAARDHDSGVVTLDDGGAGNRSLLHRGACEQPRFDARLAASKGHKALAAFPRESVGVEV